MSTEVNRDQVEPRLQDICKSHNPSVLVSDWGFGFVRSVDDPTPDLLSEEGVRFRDAMIGGWRRVRVIHRRLERFPIGARRPQLEAFLGSGELLRRIEDEVFKELGFI